ncbi:helix-turn-helix domain-containing protein [Streptomyces sp. NPDC088925]|uniref:helix-turn-helix domain-containing protein n=1 Tax=Streptomyces sp. NPDC088925 TaxID=3365914 RepID=UPI003815A382
MPPEMPPARVLDQRRAVGDRIRTARLEAAITLETLAERTGLDRKTIARTESGTHSTLLDHLLLIARALGRPLADLVS